MGEATWAEGPRVLIDQNGNAITISGNRITAASNPQGQPIVVPGMGASTFGGMEDALPPVRKVVPPTATVKPAKLSLWDAIMKWWADNAPGYPPRGR